MAESTNDPAAKPCLLIYDGNCRMCVTAKEGLERLGADRQAQDIRMIAYQSAEAQQVLGSKYRPGRPDVAFFVQPNGEVAEGLDAFFPLLPGLRGGRVLKAFFQLPLVKPLGYLLYKILARYRYRLFGAVVLESALQPDQVPGKNRSPQ